MVDLTKIEGISVNTALKVIAEVGVEFSSFKSVKHFGIGLGVWSFFIPVLASTGFSTLAWLPTDL